MKTKPQIKKQVVKPEIFKALNAFTGELDSTIKERIMKGLITPFINTAEDNSVSIACDKNGSPQGYIVIIEDGIRYSGRKAFDKIRSCTISGTLRVINKTIENADSKGFLEGRILIEECPVTELMDSDNLLRRTYLGSEQHIKKEGFENLVTQYYKRAGKEGPVLTTDGVAIATFKTFDETGELEDIIIKHDNVDEVAQYRFAIANARIAPNTDFDKQEPVGATDELKQKGKK